MADIPLIADEHVQAVCKLKQGAQTCRYLMMAPGDMIGADQKLGGFECAKSPGNEHFRRTIEDRPMTANGDNCGGWRG